MSLSIQDLDQLLNYNASTHSFTGMPQIKPGAPPAAAPVAGMAPVSTTARAGMSPVKANDMALDMARTGMATAHPVTAMPSVGGAPTAPAAAPAVPTIGESAAAPDALGGGMPSIAKPTGAQSHAAGKAEYEAGMPTMNDANGKPIAPFTPEYYQQERVVSDYERAHPYGSDVSAKPGIWGKIEHGLAKAGNIAGDVLVPNVMAAIPGTDLNKVAQRGAQMRGWEAANKGQLEQAQASNLTSETAARDASATEWKPVGEPKQGDDGAWEQAVEKKGPGGELQTKWEPMSGGPTAKIAPANRPITDADVQQHAAQLGTLTQGMDAAASKAFTDAYGAKPGDTQAQVEKKFADAKEAAQMTGAAQDRALQRAATAAQRDETNKLAEENLRARTDKAAGGTDVVRGYDKDNVPHLMSEADAKAQGLTGIMKATDKDIGDARTHNVVLNDMQVKLNDVMKSRDALNQDTEQRAIIAKALSEKNTNDTTGAMVDASVLKHASEPTKDYVQSVISLRESALGLPKEITGGSRVSEIQASALWKTLPSASSLDNKYALEQGTKFQANLDRLWQRVDAVQGMTHEAALPELGGKSAAAEFKVPEGAPTAKGVPDGKVLYADGKPAAVARGGQWTAP